LFDRVVVGENMAAHAPQQRHVDFKNGQEKMVLRFADRWFLHVSSSHVRGQVWTLEEIRDNWYGSHAPPPQRHPKRVLKRPKVGIPRHRPVRVSREDPA
jgi:hypothetical protein